MRLLILPALHLVLCLKIRFDPHGDWFLAYLVDFPASVLGMFLSYVTPPIFAFGIVGSLWWYYVGYFVRLVYRKIRHSGGAPFYVGTE